MIFYFLRKTVLTIKWYKNKTIISIKNEIFGYCGVSIEMPKN